MARRTHGSRKASDNVVRHIPAYGRRTLPCRLMAPVAIRVRSGQIVVVADVAVCAGVYFACRRQLMRARQRPASRGVIESRCQKRNRVVAGRAIGCSKRRARRGVHGVGGSLPAATIVRIQVALGIAAICRLNRQRRIIAQMALIAACDLSCGCNLVRIRQRETGAGVVEG